MAGISWNARVLAQNEPVPTDPTTVVIPLDDYQPDKLRSNVLSQLTDAGLVPAGAAKDLCRLATAVFACDVSFPRNTAFDGWTRYIHLSLPVDEPDLWTAARGAVTDLLRYLSGDQWEVEFRPYPPVAGEDAGASPAPPSPSATQLVVPDAVCLLSGGLDSFIGAADKLAQGKKLTLVSHYGAGSASHAGPAQDQLKHLMRQHYAGQIQDFTFNVDPRRGLTGLGEPSTRSRSLVFLSLGALVAATQGAPRLYIPENGLITLNIALTYSRLGSSSTRTTHPHTLNLFQVVLDALNIAVTVENPYRYATKGEMLANAVNPALVQAGLVHTMSCAHPNAARFQKLGVGHCGYCVPCIIRAAAEHRAGLSGTRFVRTYVHDVRRKVRAQARLTNQTGSDLRAFEIAILRARQKPPGAAQVSLSGPLSSDASHIADYIGVYTRGLQEVQDFLAS